MSSTDLTTPYSWRAVKDSFRAGDFRTTRLVRSPLPDFVENKKRNKSVASPHPPTSARQVLPTPPPPQRTPTKCTTVGNTSNAAQDQWIAAKWILIAS